MWVPQVLISPDWAPSLLPFPNPGGISEGGDSSRGSPIIGGRQNHWQSQYHLPSGVLHVTQSMREKWGSVRTPGMPLLEP